MKKFLLFFALCSLICFSDVQSVLAADSSGDSSTLSISEKRKISDAVLKKMPEKAQEYVKAYRTSVLENLLEKDTDPAGLVSLEQALETDDGVPRELRTWVRYYKDEVEYQIQKEVELKEYKEKMDDDNTDYDALPLIDKDLLPYLIGDDLKYVLDYKTEVLKKGSDFVLAAYDKSGNDIRYSTYGLDQGRARKQISAHHEIVHLKDTEALNKAGFTPVMLDYLGNPASIMLRIIMEARAYAEAVIFAYQRGKVLKGEYQEAYEQMLTDWDFYKVFDEAIKAGKSIEEARHLTEIAVMNNESFYDNVSYIKKYIVMAVLRKRVGQDELFPLDLDEMLAILSKDDENGPWLTKDDVYSAITAEGTLWDKLCRDRQRIGFEIMKDSSFCKEAEKRFNEACNKLEKTWGSCIRAHKVRYCSNNCAIKAFGEEGSIGKRELLMLQKDQDETNNCCILQTGENGNITDARRRPWIH